MKQAVLITLLAIQLGCVAYLAVTGDLSVMRYVVGMAVLVMIINLLPNKKA